MSTAEDYAKQATISWDEFLRRVATQPSYPYRDTRWYRAGAELEKIRTAKLPAPSPAPDVLAAYRSVLFMAQNPLDALQAPASYKVAFTADPAYDSYATKDAADQLRAAGHMVYVWYVPTEVTKARADVVASRLLASAVLGQCETADQFDASMVHGRKAMVGNLSALNQTQLGRVASGECIVVNELYRNCQPSQQPDWRNANAGVPGNCVAVYQDGDCKRMPLAQYVQDGMFVKGRDSVYGPGMLPEDWKTLRDAA